MKLRDRVPWEYDAESSMVLARDPEDPDSAEIVMAFDTMPDAEVLARILALGPQSAVPAADRPWPFPKVSREDLCEIVGESIGGALVAFAETLAADGQKVGLTLSEPFPEIRPNGSFYHPPREHVLTWSLPTGETRHSKAEIARFNAVREIVDGWRE